MQVCYPTNAAELLFGKGSSVGVSDSEHFLTRDDIHQIRQHMDEEAFERMTDVMRQAHCPIEVVLNEGAASI